MKSGVLGKVSRIEEGRNGEKPYWYQYLGRDVQEADVDWKEFLGDRKSQISLYRHAVLPNWNYTLLPNKNRN